MIAHNINIPSMIAALTDLMLSGSSHVDIMIDDDLTIRLRGAKINKTEEEQQQKNSLTDWENLEDLI